MRRFPALAFVCALACAFAAPAAQAKNQQELGAPNGLDFTAPDCPEECQAVAEVTGFQMQLGDAKNPFRIKRPGYITSFTIRLAKPTDDQIAFFKGTYDGTADDEYDGRPRARLSVVRNLGEGGRFRLLKQTQAFNLEPYLGSAPTFALRQPFRVRKDDVIALTVPTWAPAFSHNLPRDQRWRSSHSGTECTATNPPTAAHEEEGSVKVYGCFYRTARLLYTATFIGDPKPTNVTEQR